MSLTKLERDKQKLIQDKCQQILTDLLKDEDNKYCVDCDSKSPRWASWNLGIFLCIRCAGIHRNLGVHISKVKSVNLDSWTPEQVGSIQNMGNSKARAVYEANLPDSFTRPQTDSSLETFIRAKYEHKKYIAKEWVETTPKPAFDVEVELKKEKEKKKNKIKSISPISAQSSDIQSNPIPRPNSTHINGASGIGGKDGKQQSSKSGQQKSDSTDLLGLDLISSSNDEPFGFFASADSGSCTTTTSTTTNATTSKNTNNSNSINDNGSSKSLDDEEKDFFSQKIPEEKKLTKESILSLYAQAPPAPPSLPINGMMATVSANQFVTANSTFVNPTTNLMTSTNPFLANNNNSSPFMSGTDFCQPPQPQLIQGMSSLQLSSQMSPSGQQVALAPSQIASQASSMNWFSQGANNCATMAPLGAMKPNLAAIVGAANPFMSGPGSQATPPPSSASLLSGNILNFDLKLQANGSSSALFPLGLNNSTVNSLISSTPAAVPVPVNNQTQAQAKPDVNPANSLANFW